MRERERHEAEAKAHILARSVLYQRDTSRRAGQARRMMARTANAGRLGRTRKGTGKGMLANIVYRVLRFLVHGYTLITTELTRCPSYIHHLADSTD